MEKCDLTQTCKTTFVGFDITSDGDRGPWIKVLPLKIHKLKRSIIALLHNHDKGVTARSVARVTGQCIAMTKAIVPGKLLLRNVYCVIASRVNWDSIVVLTKPALKDLKWWLDALSTWNGASLQT